MEKTGICLVFNIYDSIFMIPYNHVLRVQNNSPVVPLPFTPPHIAGVCKSNDKIITVLNLSVLLDLSAASEKNHQLLQTVVVLDNEEEIGLLVGQRLSVQHFDPSLSIAKTSFISKFVKNIYTFDVHQNDIVMELDIHELLSYVTQ